MQLKARSVRRETELSQGSTPGHASLITSTKPRKMPERRKAKSLYNEHSILIGVTQQTLRSGMTAVAKISVFNAFLRFAKSIVKLRCVGFDSRSRRHIYWHFYALAFRDIVFRPNFSATGYCGGNSELNHEASIQSKMQVKGRRRQQAEFFTVIAIRPAHVGRKTLAGS
jgi:hypothetical protein